MTVRGDVNLLRGEDNPLQGMPDPFQGEGNPFQGMPDPFQREGNPFQGMPDPFDEEGNPLQRVPGLFKGVLDPSMEIDLGQCSVLGEVKSDEISIEVTYTESGIQKILTYAPNMTDTEKGKIQAQFQALDLALDQQKLIPKKFKTTTTTDELTIDIELQFACDYISTLLEGTKVLQVFAGNLSCGETQAIDSIRVKVTGLPDGKINDIVGCYETIFNDFKVVIQNFLNSTGDVSGKGGKSTSERVAIAMGVLFGLTLVGLIIVSVLFLRK